MHNKLVGNPWAFLGPLSFLGILRGFLASLWTPLVTWDSFGLLWIPWRHVCRLGDPLKHLGASLESLGPHWVPWGVMGKQFKQEAGKLFNRFAHTAWPCYRPWNIVVLPWGSGE